MSVPFLTLLLPLVLGAVRSDPPRDGRELLGMMRRVRAYRTLTFVQTTRFPGRPDETWYESAQMPGKLRIDFAPLDSQRVAIFRNDSVYSLRGGTVLRSRPYVHALLILLGDVYAAPPESTAGRLAVLGFDLYKLHESRWEGRRIYVVGALVGDSTSSQFWVDAERLYLVRMIENAPGPNGGLTDARILAHRRFGNIWVESEMVFLRNGQEVQREIYNDITVNPPLDSLIFEPNQNRRPSWLPATTP